MKVSLLSLLATVILGTTSLLTLRSNINQNEQQVSFSKELIAVSSITLMDKKINFVKDYKGIIRDAGKWADFRKWFPWLRTTFGQ